MGDIIHSNGLCRNCGLCCDGTLFVHGVLAADDDMQPWQGTALETVAGEIRYPEPCRHFSHDHCTIYSQRPACCRGFRCALLQRVENGEVEQSAAAAIVRQTRQLADIVKPWLIEVTGGNATQSFRQLSRKIDALPMQPDAATQQRHLQLGTLAITLQRYFEVPERTDGNED
ncbi:MAG TPA: YkgJ family cysteine cluster protein [Candidatus Acidoferrum sp.]|nr:YkgJ family cysteine cluster protein [Candidatus Acidoferrum sp.]